MVGALKVSVVELAPLTIVVPAAMPGPTTFAPFTKPVMTPGRVMVLLALPKVAVVVVLAGL